MTAPSFLKKLWTDPPPRYAFEISEEGIAAALIAEPPRLSFADLDPGVIAVSPTEDNVRNVGAVTARISAFAPPRGEKNKRLQRAALIVPDYAVRVAVVDFDSFPSDAQQQLSLVRFRVKKSIPFELDSAHLSYYPQHSTNGNGKRVDVIVAVAPLEILSRYELPFRTAGMQPGLITTSTLAALDLVRGTGVYVVAKLAGRILTLAVVAHGVLKLLRSIELTHGSAAEIASELYPTLAYVEDEVGSAAEKLIVCGFPHAASDLRDELADAPELEIEPLRSRYGSPDAANAGLLGYLESLEEVA